MKTVLDSKLKEVIKPNKTLESSLDTLKKLYYKPDRLETYILALKHLKARKFQILRNLKTNLIQL